MTPLGLGRCDKCHADLCVSGQMVVCANCGEPHPDHPLSVANRQPPAAARTREAVVRREDFPQSTGERLEALERRVADLEKQLPRKKAPPPAVAVAAAS